MSYNKIDINILREFIDGEVNDLYILVKKLYYEDMYMTIHDYCFKDLKNSDSIDEYLKAALFDYKLQNKLNRALKITKGKYFDEYLMNCVVGQIFLRFSKNDVIKLETEKSFLEKVLDKEKYSLDNRLTSEHNLSLLTGLLKNKFSNKKDIEINEVIDFIEELSVVNEEEDNMEFEFHAYLNKLIANKNITLHQLGNESLIKKAIYEITLDKLPTKNQIIMLTFALRLSKQDYELLFHLAKELVKNTSDSNIYSFEKENRRDSLLLYWMDSINSLDEIAKKKEKNIVEIVNNILSQSKFEILK